MTPPTSEVGAYGEAVMISGYHARQLAQYLVAAIEEIEQHQGAVPAWVRTIAQATATAGLAYERRLLAADVGGAARQQGEGASPWESVMTSSEVASFLGLRPRRVSELAGLENGDGLRPRRREKRMLLFDRADVLALKEKRSR